MVKKSFKYTLLPLFALVLLLFTGCGKEETNSENHLPVAEFEVNTYRGIASTVFEFDASMVSDEEDAVELLEVRWDWNNNGVYDTEYSTTKMGTHQYTSAGLYFPLLKVRDTKGMVDSIKKMVVVVLDINNQPPNKPAYFSPTNWQAWIEPTHIFKWSCTDPEDDALTFDFWLGTRENNLKPVKIGLDTFEATLDNLELSQDYYWRIYARDIAGNYTPGDIWKFTTSPAE